MGKTKWIIMAMALLPLTAAAAEIDVQVIGHAQVYISCHRPDDPPPVPVPFDGTVTAEDDEVCTVVVKGPRMDLRTAIEVLRVVAGGD